VKIKTDSFQQTLYLRVVLLSGVSEELDVGVAELGDGTHATAGAAAGQGIRGAGRHLSRKVKKLCSSRSLARGTMDIILLKETIFCKYVRLSFRLL
jgi:hypothetical protein